MWKRANRAYIASMNWFLAGGNALNLTRSGVRDAFSVLFDHLICPCEHVGRDRHADLLGDFQINDELEFRRCSTGKSAGLVPFRILSTKTVTR